MAINYCSIFLVFDIGLISHHDMWDYLHLSKSGYSKSFEPVHEVLLQILLDDENEVISVAEWIYEFTTLPFRLIVVICCIIPNDNCLSLRVGKDCVWDSI